MHLANIELEDVKSIFISHRHSDHILGLIGMFKAMSGRLIHSKQDILTVYCNDEVYEAIKGISEYVLPDIIVDAIYKNVNFVTLKDNDKYRINGVEYEFFDILAKGPKQYGFECVLDENRFVFLGDEPLNQELYNRVDNADYVMHEAFCLDSEADIFHPYEKNHSTALSAAKILSDLGVKNIILYHTEESHDKNRKELYTREAETVFKGSIQVPEDLEEITLVKKR